MRKLAKRSIVGTRVAAQWQDGRFYPGVIQVRLSDSSFKTSSVFTVLFDEGYSKNFKAREIVGPGFQPVSHFHMKSGQKVFVTLQSREVSATVLRHDYPNDDVLISATLPNGEEINVYKKIDEIRLLESRKSARLMDQQGVDYARVADNFNESDKSMNLSQVIDVPVTTRYHHGNSSNSNSTMATDNDIMDETAAALVLTNLSCSPTSPHFLFNERDEFFPRLSSDGHLSSSFTSSGFTSGQSDRSDPSPPHLSESAPNTQFLHPGLQQMDEGIQSDEEMMTNKGTGGSNNEGKLKTMYKCTWRLCDKVFSTCEAVESHVRTAHLGVISEEMTLDGEEEFYYTEIEVNVDTVTETFSNLFMTSPDLPITGSSPRIHDHDYQKKELRNLSHSTSSSVPSDGHAFMASYGTSPSIPIDMPQIQRSLSWQNTYTTSPPHRPAQRPSPGDRLQQHQAQSPKSHSFFSPSKSSGGAHKKARGDVRKCRKVYGMENREMWCTQCKWKKACSRFFE